MHSDRYASLRAALIGLTTYSVVAGGNTECLKDAIESNLNAQTTCDFARRFAESLNTYSNLEMNLFLVQSVGVHLIESFTLLQQDCEREGVLLLPTETGFNVLDADLASTLFADSAIKVDLPIDRDDAFFVSDCGLPAILYFGTSGQIVVTDDDGVFRLVAELGFNGSARCHHVNIEDGRDQSRRVLWRQRDLLVVDAQQIARKKYMIIGDCDNDKPTFLFDGAEFVWYEFKDIWDANGLNLKDVITNTNGDIRRMGDDLVMGGQLLHYIACPKTLSYLPLPQVRQAEYLFSLADDKLLYVSSDRYAYSDEFYESFRLFIGRGDKFTEFDVSLVDRLRDGGTTYITTEIGTLYTPPRSSGAAVASWRGQPVERCLLDDFNIQDDGNQVIITPKQN
jgi:hypothetical protein